MARDLDIIPSTCLHILRTLTTEGLVCFDPESKRYRLGEGILALAKPALRASISEQAQPYLDAIADKYQVTALAVTLSEPEQYVVVAKSQPARSFNLNVDLGNRFPALISATGQCTAAYSSMPARAMKARLERVRWPRVPAYSEWRNQIAIVRERGYAVDDGRHISGVYVVAAPILSRKREFRHAIVAVCIKAGWTKAKLQKLTESVRSSALEVAERLASTTTF